MTDNQLIKNQINQRFHSIMKGKNMNYSSFGRFLGFSAQTIKSICEGRNKPSCDIIQKTLEKCTEYEALWFTLGVGEMTRNKIAENETNSIIKILERENSILSKNNELLLKDKERLWTIIENNKDNIKV